MVDERKGLTRSVVSWLRLQVAMALLPRYLDPIFESALPINQSAAFLFPNTNTSLRVLTSCLSRQTVPLSSENNSERFRGRELHEMHLRC